MTKRLFNLVTLLLCLVNFCRAQTSSTLTTNFTWATILPAEPLAVVADGTRGAYVLLAGNTLVQIDSKGRERWKQTFTTWPTIQRVATAPDGRLLVAGEFMGQFTAGDSTYVLADPLEISTFVAEFDSTHARRWATYVLTAKGLMTQPASVATDPAGAVLIFGRQYGTGVPFLCRLDADGRFVDATLYGPPTVPPSQPVVAAADSRGSARLGITNRTRSGSFGSLIATVDDTLRWRVGIDQALGTNASRRYDTAPVDLALDGSDNLLVVSNYTLTDRVINAQIETGQVLLRYDASGQNQWVKTGVSRPDSALATGLVADPAGAFVVYGGYDGPFDPPTNQYGPADYISLAGYAPDGNLRWTTRLNAPTGNDRLIDLARTDNGWLLLLGKTTDTLPLGSLSVAGTAAAPAYYLAQLQPFVLRPAPATAVLCAGSNVTLRGTYAGYFEQAPLLQLSDLQGSFDKSQAIGTVQIGVAGNLFNATDFAVSVPLAATVAAGTTYRLRTISALPVYVGDPISVTVAVAPVSPVVAQMGEELVVSSTATAGVTYQWYTNGRQPVAGATGLRFRPTGAGAYYAVANAGGCPSPPSEALNYIITATEPVNTDISLYPNPATDRLWVRWPTDNLPGTLTLTDITGRQMRRQAKTGDVTELSVNELATGIYLLNLRTDGQPTQVRKVLVK